MIIVNAILRPAEHGTPEPNAPDADHRAIQGPLICPVNSMWMQRAIQWVVQQVPPDTLDLHGGTPGGLHTAIQQASHGRFKRP